MNICYFAIDIALYRKAQDKPFLRFVSYSLF